MVAKNKKICSVIASYICHNKPFFSVFRIHPERNGVSITDVVNHLKKMMQTEDISLIHPVLFFSQTLSNPAG